MHVSTETTVSHFLDDISEDLSIKIVHDKTDECPYYFLWGPRSVWLTDDELEGINKVIIRALKVRKAAIS